MAVCWALQGQGQSWGGMAVHGVLTLPHQPHVGYHKYLLWLPGPAPESRAAAALGLSWCT